MHPQSPYRNENFDKAESALPAEIPPKTSSSPRDRNRETRRSPDRHLRRQKDDGWVRTTV